MKKLRLDLDEVEVESFPTSALPGARAGTVAGRAADGEVSNGGECTLEGCSGGGDCSWDMGCSVDNCSDACTGYPGCSDDGNCSRLERCTGLAVCFWTP